MTAEIPPLDDEETSLAGTAQMLHAIAGEDIPGDDDPVWKQRWLPHFQTVALAVELLKKPPPPLPRDVWCDLTVMSAREQISKLVDAATLWLRAVNEAHQTTLDAERDHRRGWHPEEQ